MKRASLKGADFKRAAYEKAPYKRVSILKKHHITREF